MTGGSAPAWESGRTRCRPRRAGALGRAAMGSDGPSLPARLGDRSGVHDAVAAPVTAMSAYLRRWMDGGGYHRFLYTDRSGSIRDTSTPWARSCARTDFGHRAPRNRPASGVDDQLPTVSGCRAQVERQTSAPGPTVIPLPCGESFCALAVRKPDQCLRPNTVCGVRVSGFYRRPTSAWHRRSPRSAELCNRRSASYSVRGAAPR